jgi:hypothetical protein
MLVVASGSIQIIEVSLIRPKVFPDTFDIRAAHADGLHGSALAIRETPSRAANLSAFFALQIFLHEITDTAGLFLFRSRPIFIFNIHESCPQLTHHSSRRRTNRPAPASRLFRDKFRNAVLALSNATFLHNGDTGSCTRNAAFEK